MQRLHGLLKILLAMGSLAASVGFPPQSRAQQTGYWLPVDTVTTGPYEDHNPVMMNGVYGYSGSFSSWLVFERWTPTESQIAAMQFHSQSGRWDSTVVILGTRTLPDLQMRPDYGQTTYHSDGQSRVRRTAAWQCWKHGRWQILYCTMDDSDAVWSGPRLLVSDSLDNTAVRVVPLRDSLFLFAWKRGYAIMGLFQGPTTATPPETLAVSSSDSLGYDLHAGSIASQNWSGLVWTSKSPGGDAFLYRSVGRDSQTVLSDPETLLVRQQCSNPKFCLDLSPKTIVFESQESGSPDVFTCRPYGQYFMITNLSSDPLSENRNPRAYRVPFIITLGNAGGYGGTAGFDVCLYEKYRGPDSALVFIAPSHFENDTVRSKGYNRNATICSDPAYIGGYSRIPVVWESDRTGTSHIYARFIPLVLGDVAGGSEQPKEFALYQNYPNPFNPSTSIRYSLPHRSHVILTVFNTLGQKIAELVNGDIDAGYHEVQFTAGTLASGVYFYRLQAGSYVETKRLMLLR